MYKNRFNVSCLVDQYPPRDQFQNTNEYITNIIDLAPRVHYIQANKQNRRSKARDKILIYFMSGCDFDDTRRQLRHTQFVFFLLRF